MSRKVLIIGLDGFTWDLGRDFMAEGVMPNLGKAVVSGCHGILRSVIPCESGPAWASFQTGCYPGKTRVFGFHSYDRVKNKVVLNTFSGLGVPTLWEIADHSGKTVVSINVPITYPPPKVRGVVVPGLLSPRLSSQTVHPTEVYERYVAPRSDYRIVNLDRVETLQGFVDQQIVTENARCQMALELIKDIDWDVFAVQIQSTDAVQHHVWGALDRTATQYTNEERDEVLRFYRFIDEVIGSIMDAVGPGVLTLIMSDHGFCNAERMVNLNVWLRQKGYLKLTPGPRRHVRWRALKRGIKQQIPPVRFVVPLYRGIKNIAEKSRQKTAAELVHHKAMSDINRSVDFSKTVALSLGSLAGMIYILSDSAEKRRSVGTKLTEEIVKDLGPDSPVPVVDKISRAGEIYGVMDDSGCVPDLVVRYRRGVFGMYNTVGDEVIWKPEYGGYRRGFGTHSQEGVIVLQGPGVRTAAELDGNIVDILPTVLAYLGIPIPEHVDGKPLVKAFSRKLEISYENILFKKPTLQTEYTTQEQEQIEKKLRDVGYL